jgi:hypothetical protein
MRYPVVMKLCALSIVAVIAGLAPAAAENLAPPVGMALWCGSAFSWLARDADDMGDPAGAALFDAWAARLTALAVADMLDEGIEEDEIEIRLARSEDEVLLEMQGDEMRYQIEACPGLVPEESE